MTIQVCNPPYSLKWDADKKFEDDRDTPEPAG